MSPKHRNNYFPTHGFAKQKKNIEMLEAKHLYVKIKDQYLLQDLSLQVSPGELVAVVGANGAGKSTLLKALSGECRPSGGEVSINGERLRQFNTWQMARMRGVLSQSVHLAFSMTAIETVLLGRFSYHQEESPAQSAQIAEWALQQVQMAAFAHRDVSTLSGGEQQRVHLARILAQIYEPQARNPKYLLLDEPVSSLDIARQHDVLALAQQLTRRHQLGCLLVIHDMNLAAQYADRVVMLKQGRALRTGTPAEVFRPAFISEVFDIAAFVQQHPIFGCPQVTTYQAVPARQVSG